MSWAKEGLRRFNTSGWATVVGLIVAWQVLIDTGVLTMRYLPPPTSVAAGLLKLARSGQLAGEVVHTLGVAMAAAAVATVIGVLAGALIAMLPTVRRYMMASIDFMRSVPVIALMPAALLLWGPQFRTEIAVAVYSATWPILINTIGGVTGIHPRLYDVSKTFGLSRRQTLTKIVLPASMASILVGLRLSVVTALVVAIVAEIIINPEGLGWGLVRAQQALRGDLLFAYAIVAGTLGYLVNVALIRIVQVSLPGNPSVGTKVVSA